MAPTSPHSTAIAPTARHAERVPLTSPDPDGLDVHELEKPLTRQLTTEPGILHAAERQAWIRLDQPVDVDASGFEPRDEPR